MNICEFTWVSDTDGSKTSVGFRTGAGTRWERLLFLNKLKREHVLKREWWWLGLGGLEVRN